MNDERDTSVDRFCAECGEPIAEEYDQPERKPCPICGSTRRTHHAKASFTIQMQATVRADVQRGLNSIRLAVLGLLLSIGLAVGPPVGFEISSAFWGVVAGVGNFALAGFVLWEPHSRHYLMELAHRLTGR